MEKLIIADKKLRAATKRAFKCTDGAISHSLLFRYHADINKRIRTYAMRNGAELFVRKEEWQLVDIK
jgi:uncharacterized protein YbcV (DUF1398 family)